MTCGSRIGRLDGMQEVAFLHSRRPDARPFPRSESIGRGTSMIWRTALALATLALGPAACNPRKDGPSGSSALATQTLSQLATEVGLTFPPSARLLGVAREAGIDGLVMFKVELPRRDLPVFLASCSIPADGFERGEAGLLGPDQGFWDPSRAAHLMTGQARRNARATNVGVDDGRPDVAVLYIVNHGT